MRVLTAQQAKKYAELTEIQLTGPVRKEFRTIMKCIKHACKEGRTFLGWDGSLYSLTKKET